MEYVYYYATHPKDKNYSPLNRGRKLHFSDDGKTTKCNLPVTAKEVSDEDEDVDFEWAPSRVCKLCKKI